MGVAAALPHLSRCLAEEEANWTPPAGRRQGQLDRHRSSSAQVAASWVAGRSPHSRPPQATYPSPSEPTRLPSLRWLRSLRSTHSPKRTETCPGAPTPRTEPTSTWNTCLSALSDARRPRRGCLYLSCTHGRPNRPDFRKKSWAFRQPGFLSAGTDSTCWPVRVVHNCASTPRQYATDP